MENLKLLHALGVESIARGEDFLLGARTKATPDGRLAHLYALSILEQYHAALQLFGSDLAAHTPCLIRSMLEHLTDLINLANDPEYLNQLRAENAHSDHKVIEKYSDALAGVELEAAMAEELTALKVHLAEQERSREETRRVKIEKANTPDLAVLYSMLCALTHPNLTSLMARHVLEDDRIGYRTKPDIAVHRMLLSISIRLLSITISQFPKFTDCDPIAVSTFTAELDTKNIELQQASI